MGERNSIGVPKGRLMDMLPSPLYSSKYNYIPINIEMFSNNSQSTNSSSFLSIYSSISGSKSVQIVEFLK